MSSRPLLSSASITVGNSGEVQLLRLRIEELEGDVRALEEDLKQERQHTQELLRQNQMEKRGLVGVKKTLTPLYESLQALFGQMEAAGVADTPAQSAPTANLKWDAWKSRFPGRPAQTIDLLLVHGQMSAKQLCAAMRCDPRTLAKGPIYTLNKAQLIVKNGGLFSLREL